MFGCASTIDRMSVVPERGDPKMKIGSSDITQSPRRVTADPKGTSVELNELRG